MNEKTRVVLSAIILAFLFEYGYPYVSHYASLYLLPFNPRAFQFLDQLTGYPPLLKRIVHFSFALLLYAFFTLVLDRESYKKAFFLNDSLQGLLKGGLFASIMVAALLLLFNLTGLIHFTGWFGSYKHILPLVFAWFVAQIFNSIEEEIIYRGYLLRKLSDKFNKHICVVGISLIFGLGHFAQYKLTGVIFATTVGLIFGYSYLYYRNIYVPIGMHACWDICSHTVLSGKVIAFQPGSLLSWLGASNRDSYMFLYAMAVNILFVVVFFIWKRLWRL